MGHPLRRGIAYFLQYGCPATTFDLDRRSQRCRRARRMLPCGGYLTVCEQGRTVTASSVAVTTGRRARRAVGSWSRGRGTELGAASARSADMLINCDGNNICTGQRRRRRRARGAGCRRGRPAIPISGSLLWMASANVPPPTVGGAFPAQPSIGPLLRMVRFWTHRPAILD